jgi:hypothetical protein
MAKTRKPRAAKSGRRGISRIDQETTRTHGWFVRVGYYEDKQGTYRARHTKFFGDVSHGGKKKALAAAERFVKQVDRQKKKK